MPIIGQNVQPFTDYDGISKWAKIPENTPKNKANLRRNNISSNETFTSDFTSATIYSSSLSTGEEATVDMSSTVGGTAEFMMTSSETPTARWVL